MFFIYKYLGALSEIFVMSSSNRNYIRPQWTTIEDSSMQPKRGSKSKTIPEQLQQRNRFLTVKQVADVLGFHPETIREYARTGVIPAIRTGYRWRFDPGVFADWIRKRQR